MLRGVGAVVMATGAVVLSASAVGAQATAQVSVSPNQGAPGSQFTITLANYHACPAGSPNCIIIDFVQSGVATRIGVADSHGAPSFAGNVSVPSAAKVGDATVRAHSTTDDANTAFTVTAPAGSTTTTAATTTTTTAATTTTSSSTTSTSTSTTEPPTTTTTVPPKKSSSHSDVPRYIAVALVVIAAAATAAVDTQLRRMKPPV
ncbi:MAG: hypothetical protein JOZ04_08135 [Acidimicrobiia bacterium]|nr:hypothetical protein [Acidimicrobiia bacterium]